MSAKQEETVMIKAEGFVFPKQLLCTRQSIRAEMDDNAGVT